MRLAWVDYPSAGAWRVGAAPAKPPEPSEDGQGGNSRFDDPDGQYAVCYLASELAGCMVELLARFRPDPTAAARFAGVSGVDEDAEPPLADHDASIGQWLDRQHVCRARAEYELRLVDINDAKVLADLHHHPRVRSAVQASGLTHQRGPVELDQALIRLPTEEGRRITQVVSRVIYDLGDRPHGLAYRSRLDDRRQCWAVFGHVALRMSAPKRLRADVDRHRQAVRSAADILRITLPQLWR